jgi:mutator protein MutT
MAANTPTNYRCTNDHEYFNNPHAAVAVILVNEAGELLYAKRGKVGDPELGKFDFPGGFVDFGENAPAAAVRELDEELGIVPNDLEIIDTVANRYGEFTTTLDCIYLCRSWQGEITSRDDVAAVEWHSLDFLRSDAFAWPAYQALYGTLAKRLALHPVATEV